MVGHKASLSPIVELIQKAGATSHTTTEFHQGRTMRWGVAWTFRGEIPLSSVSSSPQSKKKANKPPAPLKFTVDEESWSKQHRYTVACVMSKIVEQLKELKVNYHCLSSFD